MKSAARFLNCRAPVLLAVVAVFTSLSARAIQPSDPGKGFDYVFYGYSPPLPQNVVDGSSLNRAMLLQDIDGTYLDGYKLPGRPGNLRPRYKLMSESPTSGVLETYTPTMTHAPRANIFTLQMDGSYPARFVFAFRGVATTAGESITVESNSALEAEGQHYLRDVLDLIHNGRRTRYVTDCPNNRCGETLAVDY